MINLLLLQSVDLLLKLALAGLLLGFLEFLRPAYPLKFFRKELKNDLLYALLNSLIIINLWHALLYYTIPDSWSPWQIFDETIQSLPYALQLFIGVLILDFSVYVRHRFMHERLWPIHAVHHSPEEISWLTKYRLHPFEFVIAVSVTSVLLFFIGFSGKAIVMAQAIFLLWDLLNHANIRLSFPKPLCYFLSCPDYHKWHHALEKEAINKNFVVMFPFLDVLFRSYYFPCPNVPKRCGMFTSKTNSEMPSSFYQQLAYPYRVFKASRKVK